MTQATDYHPMWSELGLDLDKHDALLGVLSQAYGDVFLSQKNRPDGMGYFDFVMSEVHGLRIKELVDARAEVASWWAPSACSFPRSWCSR
jgi:hypothetical protein